MTDYDRGTSTDALMVEVRTVLSRAQTALKTWPTDPRWYTVEPQPVYGEPEEYTINLPHGHTLTRVRGRFLGYSEGEWQPHPDGQAMREALEQVVELLSPWRRTGRPKKA